MSPTWRDLAEAQSYARARLVAAYLSRAADGPEVEPPRSGRALLGGLVVAALVVGGQVVRGLV